MYVETKKNTEKIPTENYAGITGNYTGIMGNDPGWNNRPPFHKTLQTIIGGKGLKTPGIT